MLPGDGPSPVGRGHGGLAHCRLEFQRVTSCRQNGRLRHIVAGCQAGIDYPVWRIFGNQAAGCCINITLGAMCLIYIADLEKWCVLRGVALQPTSPHHTNQPPGKKNPQTRYRQSKPSPRHNDAGLEGWLLRCRIAGADGSGRGVEGSTTRGAWCRRSLDRPWGFIFAVTGPRGADRVATRWKTEGSCSGV